MRKMTDLGNRLAKARLDAGFETAAEAARALDMKEPTYQGHENGNRGFKRTTAIRYARFFKVNLTWLLTGDGPMRGKSAPEMESLARLLDRGDVRGGAWLEIEGFNDVPIRGYIDVVPSRDFPAETQYALRVTGTSMNKVAVDGDYAIVASWAETGAQLEDGDLVVVQRQRGNTIEVTLKRAKRNGKIWELWPESTDPRYQEPVVLKDGSRDVEVKVIGLVLAIHKPIRRPGRI